MKSLPTDRCSQPQWPASSAEEILATLAHEWRGRLQALVLNNEIMQIALQSSSELARVELLGRLAHQTRGLRSMQQLMDQLLEARQHSRSEKRAKMFWIYANS